MTLFRTLLLAAVAASVAGDASAHVVFVTPKATAGAYWSDALKVTHGCDGSPTVAVRVEPPAGLVVTRPQPKPGWTLEIERERLAQPVAGEGGELQTERVKAITWRGRLTDDQFDTFGLAAKLPAQPGALAFRVVQTCQTGESRWEEIPVAGGPRPEHPAAILVVEPAGGGHAH